MRLDHIAYRVKNRRRTADFFNSCFGYEVESEFQIDFDDGSKAECLALSPSEDRPEDTLNWEILLTDVPEGEEPAEDAQFYSYHSPSEIFVSDGPRGSIVGDWVEERGGVGGIHHIAYQVSDVEAMIKWWREKGYAEFYSDEPLRCEETGLIQVFSKPSELTGVIYEFISRGRDNKGFCEKNVKALMESTRDK